MSDAALIWAVKDSFLSYVSSLPDGRISTSDGATTTGVTFHFPLEGADALDLDASSGRLRFRGTVEFAGHWGMLALTLSNPVVVLGREVCQLLAEIRGQLRPFAHLPAQAPHRNSAELSWTEWVPTLTMEGAREFQGSYSAGEELAPLAVRVPLPAV